MQEFFKSMKFKILLLLLAGCFFFMLRASYTNTGIPLMAKLAGFALTPVQRMTTSAYNSLYGTVSEFITAPRIADERDALRDENARLRQELVELERHRAENSQLREYLEIKEKNRDFQVEPAIVIGRDTADRFYSFIIDKGSIDGIARQNPVITAQGLVGMVTEVHPTFSKVLTILDTTMQVGAMDVETREIGITEGTVAAAMEGKLRLSLLPRDSKVEAGNLVVTTGVGGLFPQDLIIGSIEAVFPDGQGLSLYAEIKPVDDLRKVQKVMVIKHFEGQWTPEDE